MENRETIKEELTELLEKYYDGSFAFHGNDTARSRADIGGDNKEKGA